jgi:FkbM family methyltransferase
MNTPLKKIKNMFLGQKRFQKIFERLYRIALYGMNIGSGGTIATSGEIRVLEELHRLFGNKKSVTIFDVGANKGEYSEAVVDIFTDKSFRLYVFEPSKTAFSLLKEQVALKSPSIFLANTGISDIKTTTTLYSTTAGSKLGSLYARTVPGKKFSVTEEITLTTIDTFCSEHNIAHINFLKLDIEGSELAALKGAEKLLSQKAITAIQFEFGGANIDSRTYFRDFWNLLSFDYQIYRILKDGLHAISKYDEKLELFSTTNYLAIKKELATKL